MQLAEEEIIAEEESNETKITSVQEYIAKLDEIFQDVRGNVIFRGQADVEWPLESSATRRIKRSHPECKRNDVIWYHNDVLLKNAKLQGYHKKDTNTLHDLELLAELRHYGAATFFLDFTKDALIALYFACCECNTQDEGANGVVYLLDTSDLLKFKQVTPEVLLTKNIHDILEDDVLWIWNPENINYRILRQNSVFIFGYPERLDEKIISKVTIDKKEKIQILRQLRRIFNIKSGSLFCDLHGFCNGNQYTELIEELHADDYVNEAIIHFQECDKESAMASAQYALELDDESSRGYAIRGLIHYCNGNKEAALSDYSKAVELSPNDNAGFHFFRADLYIQLGEIDRSFNDVNNAIRIEDQNHMYFELRSSLKEILGDFEGANQDKTIASNLRAKLENKIKEQ